MFGSGFNGQKLKPRTFSINFFQLSSSENKKIFFFGSQTHSIKKIFFILRFVENTFCVVVVDVITILFNNRA